MMELVVTPPLLALQSLGLLVAKIDQSTMHLGTRSPFLAVLRPVLTARLIRKAGITIIRIVD